MIFDECKDANSATLQQKRVFLFLQGPASPFMRHVAHEIEARGSQIRHISFCLGDRIFWGLRRTQWFRQKPDKWPEFLRKFITAHKITDLIMLGDGRPVHSEAIDVAFDLGTRVHILEHGYIRPDWLTLEPDGMSGYSRFPRDPAKILKLAKALPEADFRALYRSSFLRYALYDLIYHLPNVAIGWLIHPHYRRHGPVHPLVEYSGWAWKAIKAPFEAQHRAKTLLRLMPGNDPLFLFPLQLPGDYQIKVHAPGGDLFALVNAVIHNFARHAPDKSQLLFKIHPIDNGLSRWHERIGGTASTAGIAERVYVINGGSLDALIERSNGVVTINSTVGTAALIVGKPLIALGNAIFSLAGLTHQGSLASFWAAPSTPDPVLVDAFLRVLVDKIQLRGGFIDSDSVAEGARTVATRLLEPRECLPVADRRPRHSCQFIHSAELFDAKTDNGHNT